MTDGGRKPTIASLSDKLEKLMETILSKKEWRLKNGDYLAHGDYSFKASFKEIMLIKFQYL